MMDCWSNTAGLPLTAPLVNAIEADFSVSDYTFECLPRALNCSGDGTLKVDIGKATGISIRVVAGLNPYRVAKIYTLGSAPLTVVGMW